MPPIVGFIILIGYTFGLIVIGILLSLEKDKVCVSDICQNKSLILRGGLNKNVKPCDNFYQFVCGPGGKSTELKIIGEIQDSRLIDLLAEKLSKTDGKVLNILKNIYRDCINVKGIEDEGLNPLINVLQESGGFPMISVGGAKWNDGSTVKWSIVNSYALGTFNGLRNRLFDFDVQDHGERRQLRLLIPESLLHLEKLDEQAYTNYITDLLSILSNHNISKSDNVEEQIKKVVQLKSKLVEMAVIAKHCSDENTKVEKLQLNKVLKNTKFLTESKIFSIFEKMTGNEIARAHIRKIMFSSAEFKVYLKDAVELLDSLADDALQTYTNYQSIENTIYMTPYLPKVLRDLYNKYFKNGKDATMLKFPEERNLLCAKTINYHLPTTLTHLLLKRYKSNSNEMGALFDVVSLIKHTSKKRLKQNEWMEPLTKSFSVDKINLSKFASPFPDDLMKTFLNEKKSSDFHMKLCYMSDSILDKILELDRFTFKNIYWADQNKDWNQFNEYHDFLSLKTYYDFERHVVVVPYELLNFPTFQRYWPKYINYGDLGSQVAKNFIDLITKKFYPSSEDNESWWTNDTLNNYYDKRKCFVDQFNTYLNPFKATLHNANCTEDIISETGGVRIAFNSYKSTVEERFWSEPRLPKMYKYPGYQLFFIDYAARYCTKQDLVYSENVSELEIQQASNEFRVLTVLRNLDVFSKTFQCKEGDNMNPKKKCLVW